MMVGEVHGPWPTCAYDQGGTRFAIMNDGKLTASSAAERRRSTQKAPQIRRP